jgi:hypothetical protein
MIMLLWIRKGIQETILQKRVGYHYCNVKSGNDGAHVNLPVHGATCHDDMMPAFHEACGDLLT